jgi:hypothetical protein
MEARKANRIRIWKFAEAPEWLRLLKGVPQRSGWFALVPLAIWGRDVEELIVRQPKSENVLRYKMPNGDIVYWLRCKDNAVRSQTATLTRDSERVRPADHA